MPAITRFGFSFFTSSSWDPVKEAFGALPAIYGTLLSSAIGLLIAVPISLGAAIFLVELAPKWLKGPASFIIEMLAAIPRRRQSQHHKHENRNHGAREKGDPAPLGHPRQAGVPANHLGKLQSRVKHFLLQSTLLFQAPWISTPRV